MGDKSGGQEGREETRVILPENTGMTKKIEIFVPGSHNELLGVHEDTKQES